MSLVIHDENADSFDMDVSFVSGQAFPPCSAQPIPSVMIDNGQFWCALEFELLERLLRIRNGPCASATRSTVQISRAGHRVRISTARHPANGHRGPRLGKGYEFAVLGLVIEDRVADAVPTRPEDGIVRGPLGARPAPCDDRFGRCHRRTWGANPP